MTSIHRKQLQAITNLQSYSRFYRQFLTVLMVAAKTMYLYEEGKNLWKTAQDQVKVAERKQ